MRAYWRFASSSAVVDNRRKSDPPSRSIMNVHSNIYVIKIKEQQDQNMIYY